METVFVPMVDGGMTNDPRDARTNVARIITNFDVLRDSSRAIPYRSAEDGDNAATTSKKQNYCIALWGPTGTYRLFALGVISGNARAEILMKLLTTGGANDLDDNTWATPAANQSSAGTTNFELFIYYKKMGKIFGAKAGTTIWSFTPDGSTAFDDGGHSISYTTVAQGVVHPADDILYIPYDNKIAVNNNGTWTDQGLVLPDDLYITSVCPFGNFLAIACAPKSGVGISRVFLWDRDTSLTTTSENIDWGEGNIKILEESSGELVGVSLSGANTVRFNDRVYIRRYTGYGSEVVPGGEFVGSTDTQLAIAKQKINERVYFMMSITLNGSVREGVFSLGHKPGQNYSLFHERTPNNDTALVTGSVKNFIFIGDYLFQSYVTNGNFAVSKTDDQASYTATSIIETIINPFMVSEHKRLVKRLVVGQLTYDPLPSGGSVVLQYRVENKNFKTIFTETRTGATSTEETRNTDKLKFDPGREIEFKITSTGGVNITGLGYAYIPDPLAIGGGN